MTNKPLDYATVFCHDFTVGMTVALPTQDNSSDESEVIVESKEVERKMKELEKVKTLNQFRLAVRPIIRFQLETQKKMKKLQKEKEKKMEKLQGEGR